MSHKCHCNRAGHCPFHDAITDQQTWAACKEGTPPEGTTPKPCVYLGEQRKRGRRKVDQPIYECRLYDDCTLLPNGGRLSDCSDCGSYLPADSPDMRKRFIDPLRITDREGNKTHVLRNLLQDGAAFLVCGGPSVKTVAYQRLAERGIFSLGVNNVAGQVPVSAFTCSDPPEKFHHGIFTDPKVMKFLPTPKLRANRGKLREKVNGEFRYLPYTTKQCPNIWGYERRSWLACDETWFTESSASWGNQQEGVNRFGGERAACTMLLGLRLLQYLGARRVFLLGVDFWMDPLADLNSNYAFGEVRDKDAIESNNRHYRIVNDWLIRLRTIFESFGFFVYNCNPVSGLRAFDHVAFDTALEICRSKTPKEPFDLVDWYAKDRAKNESGNHSAVG